MSNALIPALFGGAAVITSVLGIAVTVIAAHNLDVRLIGIGITISGSGVTFAGLAVYYSVGAA